MSLIERKFKELSDRLGYFIQEYKKQNRVLKRKELALLELEEKYLKQTEELNDLKEKYNKIRVAKSITELGENPVKVRKKVNELIRGIDKCIARLNK